MVNWGGELGSGFPYCGYWGVKYSTWWNFGVSRIPGSGFPYWNSGVRLSLLWFFSKTHNKKSLTPPGKRKKPDPLCFSSGYSGTLIALIKADYRIFDFFRVRFGCEKQRAWPFFISTGFIRL